MTRRKIYFIVAIMVMAASRPATAQESPESAGKNDDREPCVIKGTVKAADGSALPGATVSLKEEKLATVATETGRCALTGVPQGQVTVTASLP